MDKWSLLTSRPRIFSSSLALDEDQDFPILEELETFLGPERSFGE